jgi:hypothetical protein
MSPLMSLFILNYLEFVYHQIFHKDNYKGDSIIKEYIQFKRLF